MPRATIYKPSGNVGEITPRLHARTDFTKYGAAWALCENMVPLAEGAMMRRSGTRYVHALGDQTKRGRPLPFLFSNTDAYVLIAEEGEIRFNRNQGQITVANTDAAVSNGAFDSDITGWDDRSSGGASIAHDFIGLESVSTLEQSAVASTPYGDGVSNRKFAGFQFIAPATGSVRRVEVSVGSITSASDYRAFFYTDSAGSPNTQVGAASATVAIGGSGIFTFTWASPPGLTASTTYWVVLEGISASGQVNFAEVSDQGSAFASGSADVATSITDVGPGGRPLSSRDFRIRVSMDGGSTNGVLALVGNGSDVASAEQDVTTTNTGQEHVLRFRVIGAPGDAIKLRVGNTTEGDQVLADLELTTGFHSIAFTPEMSPFYVQFRNEANKTIYIDDVSLLDNEAFSLKTPYAEADLPSLNYAQSADVMYFAHPSHKPYKLERRGNTTWSFVEVAFDDGPYLDENTDASMTLDPSDTTGNGITIEASGFEPFKADDVGRPIRLAPSGEPGWAVITEVVSSSSVKADVKRDFGAASATASWRLGAWSGDRGYPSTVGFYEQRTVWAGTTEQPQTFWMTQTGDLENMRPDSFVSSAVAVEDDDALDYTLSANEVNTIVWVAASADAMFIGTSGGIWRPTSAGAVLTPTDITVRRQVSSAAAGISPLPIDNVVLFAQKGKRKIRELGFNFEADGYRAIDMTRLAQHITYGDIREIAFAEEPESQVFALLENGKLLSMTFRREEDVVGWTRHILGGSFGSGDAVVEGVTVIPGNNGAGQTHDSTNRNEVWVIVKRTIDGNTNRYVEFFERDHEDGHDAKDAFYVDCGLTYDGSPATTITGFAHLEGQTLKVWADGDVVGDVTVSSGQFTLSTAASVVQAGLGYTHKLRNLKSEGGAAAGTAVTKRKRYVKMGVVVQHSHEIKFGPTASNLTTVDLSTEAGAVDNLFTGEIVRDWPDGWKNDPRVYIEGDAPAPFVLLALAPESDTKDFV